MYEFPELPILEGNAFNAENDPTGMAKIRRIELEKRRTKKLEDFEDNNKKIYTIIKGQCTDAMWNKIKEDQHFDDFDKEQALLPLWKRITDLLLTAVGTNQNEIIIKQQSKLTFELMKQRESESVADFHRRFIIEVEAMNAIVLLQKSVKQ
jgi:hypothetical protein